MKMTKGLLVLVFLMTSISLVSAATSVYVSPATSIVGSGQVFDVELKITTNESIWASAILLDFNPSFLQAQLITEGDFLKQGSSSTYPITKIDNVTGQIQCDITRFGASSGATGSGTLCSVTFKVVGTGQSNLTFNQARLFNYPDLNELTVTKTSGLVKLNNPPNVSGVAVSPSSPKTTDSLQAVYTYSDLDGDSESGTEIRWYKNSVLQSAYNDQKTVPSSATKKGEQWYFTVKPKDGTTFGNLVTSPTATIQNTAPVINIYSPTLLTLILRAGNSQLFNHTSSDVDGDTLNYSWKLNSVTKATTQSWTFSPSNADCGNGSVLLEVSDGSITDTQSWSVQVLLRGEVNKDNKVDIFDLAAVGLCYGKAATGSCADADLNKDSKIDIFDLATVGLDYGETC